MAEMVITLELLSSVLRLIIGQNEVSRFTFWLTSACRRGILGVNFGGRKSAACPTLRVRGGFYSADISKQLG
jgi:hypothetical protein